MEQYTKMKLIGEGIYGQVFKGKNKITGQFVAMKKIRLESDTEQGIPAISIREMSLLRQFCHPNIVKLEGVVLEMKDIYLIFEFLQMDLQRYMENFDRNEFMKPAEVKSYLYQINNAILYCHKRAILHRDLKPQNLLVDGTGIIKVADFGLGRTINVPVRVLTHQVVTLWYRAPEILLGNKYYSAPIDMWSVGCIFSEMASKKPLFPGKSEINQLYHIFRALRTPTEQLWPGVTSLPNFSIKFPKWKIYQLEKYAKKLDDSGMELLQLMLEYDPAKRVSAKEARRHRYFHDVELPAGLAQNLASAASHHSPAASHHSPAASCSGSLASHYSPAASCSGSLASHYSPAASCSGPAASYHSPAASCSGPATSRNSPPGARYDPPSSCCSPGPRAAARRIRCVSRQSSGAVRSLVVELDSPI